MSNTEAALRALAEKCKSSKSSLHTLLPGNFSMLTSSLPAAHALMDEASCFGSQGCSLPSAGDHACSPLAVKDLWPVAPGMLRRPGEMLEQSSPMERRGEQLAAPSCTAWGGELHRAPCCRFTPDCNQYNLLKLIYFLLSFAHKYSCCNSSLSMTFGEKTLLRCNAFFTL